MTQKGQFKKGVSGNPAGKKPGTKNKTTLLAQQMAQGDLESIMTVVLEKAKQGDPTCLKLVVPRLWPAPRTPCVQIDLPKTDTPQALAEALDAVLAQVGEGILSPEAGRDLVGLFDVKRRVLETAELETRLARIEALVAAAE